MPSQASLQKRTNRKSLFVGAAISVTVALAVTLPGANAYLHAATPLGGSRFVGQRYGDLVSPSQQPHVDQRQQQRRQRRMVVEAKKGKPNVPINQRGDYMQKQRMQDQMAMMKPEAGGYPLFNLYVRTPRANMWYPCGTLKGDDRSKQLVDGWIQNGFGLGGMIKGNIDKSVAGSLYAKEDSIKRLSEQICKTYPALKAAKKDFTFGYKIEYENLDEKQDVTILSEDMNSGGMLAGPLDGLRNAFGRLGASADE